MRCQRTVAGEQKTNLNRDGLVQFASIGLALQDEAHRKSLGSLEKSIVDGLRAGTAPLNVPIGFPLAPQQFRAQSFYTQSPELSDYFAARQWYATVAFRLANAHETRLALALADLVNMDPELLTLWESIVGPARPFPRACGRRHDSSV